MVTLRACRLAGHGQEERFVSWTCRETQVTGHAACVAVLVLAVTASHCTGYSLQPRRGSPDGIDSTDSRPRKLPIVRVLADREAARWGKTSRLRACQPVRTPPGTRTRAIQEQSRDG
ncbi:hypothetical protein E4U15_000217 [Claviceps sp. LM218 group G6]|nr:hypothetical protein E4U15_000217 [Claviceps sp. LM218 group G6]